MATMASCEVIAGSSVFSWIQVRAEITLPPIWPEAMFSTSTKRAAIFASPASSASTRTRSNRSTIAARSRFVGHLNVSFSSLMIQPNRKGAGNAARSPGFSPLLTRNPTGGSLLRTNAEGTATRRAQRRGEPGEFAKQFARIARVDDLLDIEALGAAHRRGELADALLDFGALCGRI